MLYLLDTNVISEVRRPRPNPGVVQWFDAVADADIRTSVLVIGEIRQGVERLRRRDPAAAEALDSWLGDVRSQFTGRLLPVDAPIAERWGALNAHGPLPVVDGLLAATALVHELTLVTRNVADVARTGARTLNPFT